MTQQATASDILPTASGTDGSVPLLEVKNLVVRYGRLRSGHTAAVDNVSFDIRERETLGVVGESGSGKTSIGRAILGLAPIADGSVALAGRDITHAGHKERRAASVDLQAVFQDPYGSLNPSRTVGYSVSEPLQGRPGLTRIQIRQRVLEMLGRVGLQPEAADRFPAQFSGGQRQRIAIARALIMHPRLVICDEPVSALDLCVQAQVMNLFREIQRGSNVSYLFIAHNLDVVRYLSQRVLVLYRGRVVELGDAQVVTTRPSHPYTQALLESQPFPDPALQRKRRAAYQAGRSKAPIAVADGSGAANGCPYARRCQYVAEICVKEAPGLERKPDGNLVSCHRWLEIESAIKKSAPSTT